MKLKLLAASIVAACAGNASAFAPGTVHDLELFIAGASAQDKALRSVVTSLCDDQVDNFTDDASKPEGSNYAAYSCTMSGGKVPGLSAPLKVLVHKRSRGGSAFGAAPVEAKDTIQRMNIGANCTETAAGSHLYVCTTAALANDIPDAGITDVEPAMFRGSNLLRAGIGGVVAGDPGTTAMTDGQLARLDQRPVAALTFGVVVNTALRDALQVAQGLTAGNDAEANMPSLTSTQIASLFAGNVTNWSEFKVFDPAVSGYVDLTARSGITAPANVRVNVCRRTPGSGTQAQFNAHFLSSPCVEGAVTPRDDNTGASATNGTGNFTSLIGVVGPAIHWNESSGNLDSCLTAIQTANRWAIGIHSLEKGNANYRFVKVDGVAPTLQNVATGKYFDYAATSVQWINENQSDAPGGDTLTLLKQIRSDLGKPAELAALNTAFNPRITGAQVGFAALSTNGHALSIPFSAANPVIGLTNQGISGTGLANTCRTPVVVGGQSQM